MLINSEKISEERGSRLYQVFGLINADIQDVVMQGLLARTACTPHHPRTYPGLAQWAETVRALRDKTVPSGWDITNVNNFPLAIHPSEKVVIAVQTGDRDTGIAAGNPSNRAAKGATTEGAVAVNQQQLGLFDSLPPLPYTDAKARDALMWVLLYHVSPEEIRFELSLPLKMVGGKIRSWKERIVFPPIRFDDANIYIGDVDDNGTDFDIQIERRENRE